MIVVKLRGGLGNQLFQYALGRSKSEQLNDELYLDRLDYQINNERVYELDSYPIQARMIDNESIVKIFADNTLLRRLLRKNEWNIIREKSSGFQEHVLKVKGNLYFDGYWNSYKYFNNYRNILLKELLPKKNDALQEEAIDVELRKKNSVSVHVRRGDYLNSPEVNAKHGLLGIEYYKRAVSELADRYSQLRFFIFSEDETWVKENIQFIPNCMFMPTKSAVEDLYKQNLCNHHIIANSTFSWWGAWLSSGSGTTIAPKKWSNDPVIYYEDVFPPEWVTV